MRYTTCKFEQIVATYSTQGALFVTISSIRFATATLAAAVSLLAQGTWTTLAPMPIGVHAFGMARTPDGKIYVMGGDIFSGTYTPVSYVQIYNPATNTWSTGAPMPTARYNLTAAYSNGKIYAFGGYSPFAPRTTVEAYDPAANTWSTVAPLPIARHNLRAVTVGDGRIFVIGGDFSGGGANTDIVQVYDPIANSWSNAPSMPNTKSGAAATLGNDGRIYVVGGGQSGILVASLFVFDLTTNTWSVKTPMSVARSGLGAATAADGRIVVIGGEESGVHAEVEIYDPATDSWSFGTPMPTSRAGLGLVTGIDGRMFAIGGWVGIPGGLHPLGTNEAYTPAPPAPVYNVCPLFDQTKPVKAGATIPIKLQLCGPTGNNLSSSSIVVHATGLTLLSNSTTADIQDAGNANPDFDFRYDATIGGTGGYIFNLKTTGLATGTYQLSFTAGAAPGTFTVNFQVK